ncbi:OsmC family protein [Puia dinghuensis]|uniref:Peroxiredoxin n=1 Tax=Puia dinghuensis TaxID=1792502 RepID=A0A8J2U706_9BACT|nr:OsmC family protein [Puia dinghuensis]GGA83019.1 peroxiredoxin [Puia dinghuensis]
MKRTATAAWSGSGKEGNGHLTTQSTTLNNTQYSYKTRFEDGVGTNPEELIAAAHAGCYTMALAFALQGAGFTPESLETTATVNFDVSGTPTITQSALVLKAKIPGITNEKFQELAKGAESGCPVSRVLKAEITLQATLL